MSTDISHGYRLNIRPEQVFDWAKKACKGFEKTLLERLNLRLVSLAVALVDRAPAARVFGMKRPPVLLPQWTRPQALSIAFHELEKSLRDENSHDSREFLLDVTLFQANKTVLALLHTRGSATEKWFRTIADPWPYWNGSDMPDGMTCKEWDHRKRTWDKALWGARTPVEAGLHIQSCNPRFALFDVYNTPPIAPDLHRRARTQVIEVLWQLRYPNPTEMSGGNIMQAYNEILAHPKLEKLTRMVMRQLPVIRQWNDLNIPIATRKPVDETPKKS